MKPQPRIVSRRPIPRRRPATDLSRFPVQIGALIVGLLCIAAAGQAGWLS